MEINENIHLDNDLELDEFGRVIIEDEALLELVNGAKALPQIYHSGNASCTNNGC